MFRPRLVLVDNRGIGHSDQAADSYDIAGMAGDVVAVLDAAGVSRTHVLGVSPGGMVAQELAITHPERVDRLVLACTTPGWPSGYPMPAASVRLMTVARGPVRRAPTAGAHPGPHAGPARRRRHDNRPA
jgi:3-oxoadipate enol-lactonase